MVLKMTPQLLGFTYINSPSNLKQLSPRNGWGLRKAKFASYRESFPELSNIETDRIIHKFRTSLTSTF